MAAEADAAPAWALSAAEAARRLRAGRLSALELVEGCLERIREVEPQVQAWHFLDEEHARSQARAADAHRLSGAPFGALTGIPVGVKDNIDTGDMPTECGTAVYAGRTPRRDAAVVARLRAAGAVILGKTVTTEYAYLHPGKTRNPHDPECTPGGSSSGSAAAVAAHMVPVAIGTQTNGSVIRPAAFCGVYGFKPTHGLVPRTGILPLSRTLDHVGVFARTLEDLALVAEEIVGYDEGDPDAVPRARVPFRALLEEDPPLAPMFALVKTPYWERTEADTRAAFAELAAELGAQCEEVELFPSAREAWDWHRTIMEAEMAANLERDWRAAGERFSAVLRAALERGRTVRAVDYLRARAAIGPLVASFDELFMQRYDAILTPAAPGPAPRGLEATGDPSFCTLWTLAGLPAVTLPLARAANGLPIGVQLVGRRGFDARLLRTARWLVAKLS